ncbi:MAG TPA: TRAP transporter TatT component family protein [Candidatus Aminicenantes bacterium]|nr:TRAP transporter TatT component family protein [Candidatus Aminicenantes bacterium]HRY64521.1 TRAP transporter TatT component family protein [Candidatus Aminicenantes bacterium]HRZ71434.1 TRAP transporter TatT component family protein [Candidatus Aminicenantes bacterium]
MRTGGRRASDAGQAATPAAAAFALILAVGLGACSIEKLALKKVAGMLSSSSSSDVFASDNDPDLVGQALPFAIKLYESLLASLPNHAGLRLRTGSLYIMYANAFVESPADMTPRSDIETKEYLLARAKNLYLRGRDILFIDLEKKNPALRAQLKERKYKEAMAPFGRGDATLLYWTALGWLAAFAVDPFDMTLGQTVPQTRAMIERVAELEPGYGGGSLDSFYITYYGSLPGYLGGDLAKAREHFARAQALAGGSDTSSLLALATTVCVKEQNAAEFKALVGRVLAFDPETSPANRLSNTLNRRKARWLLAHIDDFFIEVERP